MQEQNPDDIPLLTYNSLYNLLREEKRNKIIQKLPEFFYEALNKFINNKEEEIKGYIESEDLENLKKQKLILKNSLKISKEITNLRCTKIANIAIKNELFDSEILPTGNILNREFEFFESVKKSVKKLK